MQIRSVFSEENQAIWGRKFPCSLSCRHFKPFRCLFLFPWTNHLPFLLRPSAPWISISIFYQYKPFESGTRATVGLGWSCGWSKYEQWILWQHEVKCTTCYTQQCINKTPQNVMHFDFDISTPKKGEGLMAIFAGVPGPLASLWCFKHCCCCRNCRASKRCAPLSKKHYETIEKRNSLHIYMLFWLSRPIVKE